MSRSYHTTRFFGPEDFYEMGSQRVERRKAHARAKRTAQRHQNDDRATSTKPGLSAPTRPVPAQGHYRSR